MGYELKPYQKIAVYDAADGLLANTLRFLKSPKHQRVFVLKAIMGSGKTIIASEFIEAILNSNDTARTDKELCVIWLSKGNAGLHMQSSEKLEKAIGDRNIHIYGIGESTDFNADRFYDKDVYVINWEKINNLKDGELVNNLFVDSEMKNLRSAKRNSPDVEYICIIDEFHLNYGTNSYKKIIEFFDPHVIIGMSATPSDAQMARADARYYIPVADVIAEGMVKKGVCFNTATNYTDDEISQYDTIDEFFLRLAIRQRDILEQKYRTAGSDVIPLLLIQCNDDKSNEDIIRVKDILDKEYDNNKDDIYAIWISETDNKKDRLRSPDRIIQGLAGNSVRILLFKQAVATGWDCPRAHVLLRYRRVATRKDANTTSAFDIQTLGRIFRMPEPNRFAARLYKHYDDEDLNYGYVYIPNNNYTLEKEFRQAFGDDVDIFRKTVVTVDYEPESNPVEEPKQTSLPDVFEGNTAPDNPQTEHGRKNIIPVPAETPKTALQSHTESVAKQNIADHSPTVPVKAEAQAYAKQYGPAIRKSEELLSTVNVVAVDKRPDDQEISHAIKEILKGITVQRDLRKSDSYTGQLVIRGKAMEITDALFETDAKVSIDETGKSFSISDTPSVLSDKADKLLTELIDRKQYPKAVKDYMKCQIKHFFRKEIAGCEETDDESSAKTSKLILLNEGIIRQVIRETDDAIRELSRYEFVRTPYKFPTSFRIPPNAVKSSKGLMHLPLPDTASGPELTFESILNRPENNVLLWYKNTDHGANAFCVKYKKRNQMRGRTIETEMPTYPDFIVIFKDGGIGMYETKDYDKQDENDIPKALAISETVGDLIRNGYIAKGGLIYIDQQSGNMRDAEKYPEFQ